MHVVYVIENPQNGRYYVGSTSRLARRRSDHLSALRRGAHENPRVQREWDKYGPLLFRPFACALRAEDLAALEQAVMDDALAAGLALNINRDTVRHRLGIPLSEEAKARLSAERRGKRLTPEQRAARAVQMARYQNPMQGRQHSEETRQRISNALKAGFANGRKPTIAPPSPEARAAAASRLRANPPRLNKGKPLRGVKDGEVRVWPTTIACAKDIGCNLAYPSQRVGTGKSVKGWVLTYLDRTVVAETAPALPPAGGNTEGEKQ